PANSTCIPGKPGGSCSSLSARAVRLGSSIRPPGGTCLLGIWSLVGCVKFAQTHHFMNAGASSSTRRTGYRSCPQGLDLATRDIDIDIVHVHGSALEGRALEQFGKGTRNAELWASFSSRYHKDCPRSQAVIFTGRSTSPEAGAS
ncbi:MAG: hypothetical protein ACLQU5_35375, partial [Isosphaeraceae bacterium]